MRIKTITNVFYIGVLLLIVTACGTNKEDEIIGKWKNDNGDLVDFREDGVVTGLTKNVNKELVDGTYKIKDDSLLIEFWVMPAPRNIRGNLDFRILKLNADSLILDTDLGSLNYWRTLP